MQVIAAPTLFATHFHELTGLKSDVGVANLHVETAIDQDSGKLTMLYQVTRSQTPRMFHMVQVRDGWVSSEQEHIARTPLTRLHGPVLTTAALRRSSLAPAISPSGSTSPSLRISRRAS